MSVVHSEEDAYARLVEPYRNELHAHCYRMLGSSDDAEEALQEALLRAWRGLPRFQGRSSVRSWLYRISTNACLDAIQRRRPVVPVDYELGPDLHDPSHGALAPSAEREVEEREDLERAFAAAMELLPRPRAVLIMRTALGFSARETADALGTSVASVNSALQRARKVLDERSEVPELVDERVRALAERCADAMRHGDVGTVVRLLADEV
jgi:RNA polymerase sigma-70 factor, ECF subfamily